MKCSIVEDIDK